MTWVEEMANKKKNFYAVAVGRKPGIYDTWEECNLQVNGFRGASYKGFRLHNEAMQWYSEEIEKNSEFPEAFSILREIYGDKATFRIGQYEAIESVFKHHRTLVVQKTGWGKSLIYFISARMIEGLTIVISPLLILMDSQKEYAEKLGLRCEILNYRVKGMDRRETLSCIARDGCDVLFTTPETLYAEDVQSILPNLNIGMFVVDECHCISDWGHDFRLKYSRLNNIIQNLPINVHVLGTTATANDRVIEDLKKQFGNDVFVLRGPLSRSSLHIQVLELETKSQRYAWILKNIKKMPGSGIIYCLTRRDCQQLSDFLNENGISSRPYFSASELERKSNENRPPQNEETEMLFRKNQIKVVVATIKLGMGYDKPDIGFVIHFNCPSSIMAYYQQIGRAGRKEGVEAYCFLMVGQEDKSIHEYFINNAFPSAEEEKNIVDALKKNTCGLSIKSLLAHCNLSPRAIERALMFLDNNGIIYYEKGKYHRSFNPYKYTGEHYESVRQSKKHELNEIQGFFKTQECYSRYMLHALNDNTASECGKCSNCTGKDILLGLEPVTIEEINAIQEQLNQSYIKIMPRKKWPEIDTQFNTELKIGKPNEIGIALCKYGDVGFGEMVRHDKYKECIFRDNLVEASACALKGYVREKGHTFITNIPSSRNGKVANFASRLAFRLGCEYIDLLEASSVETQQKDMQNSIHQYRNAKAKIKLKSGVRVTPSRVILVDDMVDSKWTLTVAGYLLTQSGWESVFPFCLADSSQSEVTV